MFRVISSAERFGPPLQKTGHRRPRCRVGVGAVGRRGRCRPRVGYHSLRRGLSVRDRTRSGSRASDGFGRFRTRVRPGAPVSPKHSYTSRLRDPIPSRVPYRSAAEKGDTVCLRAQPTVHQSGVRVSSSTNSRPCKIRFLVRTGELDWGRQTTPQGLGDARAVLHCIRLTRGSSPSTHKGDGRLKTQ